MVAQGVGAEGDKPWVNDLQERALKVRHKLRYSRKSKLAFPLSSFPPACGGTRGEMQGELAFNRPSKLRTGRGRRTRPYRANQEIGVPSVRPVTSSLAVAVAPGLADVPSS